MCFEDEERITVGSSAYNLAGDVARRGNFMKNNILNLIFSGVSDTGLGKGIVDAHMAGPAVSLNRFYKWAEFSGYNTQVGNLGGVVYNSSTLSPAAFAFLVPVKTELIVPTPAVPPLTRVSHDQRAISFTTSALDITLVALEWIINNTPLNRDRAYKAALEKSGYPPTVTGRIVITYTDGTPSSTFTPAYNLSNNMPLVYLYHEERVRLSQDIIGTDPDVDDGWVTLAYPATPPSRASFVAGNITVLQDDIPVPAVVTVSGAPVTVPQIVPRNQSVTSVTSYSNGTPTSTSVTNTTLDLNFDKITGKYTKTTTVTATPTIKGEVTVFVQDEESFYNVLTSTTSSTNSVVVPVSSAVSFISAADTRIDSTGTPVTDVLSKVAADIPINPGDTLVASHPPGAGGYCGLISASGLIPASLTTSGVLSYMPGATFAYFSYPTATVGYGVTRDSSYTQTTTVTTVTPYLQVYWKYKQVSTATTKEKWLPYLLKLYQKGMSTQGDSLLFNAPVTTKKFFPVIPLRRDNVMVDLVHFPTQYGWNRKAAKKAFGSKKKYNDLIDSLADNPSLADIDHTWVVFGVSLSTKQQDGQKYLYEFFKNLSDSTISAVGAFKSPTDFASAWADYVAELQISTNDETGVTLTTRPVAPVAQEYTLTINASSAAQDWLYNTSITCRGGGQTVGNGYHVKSSGKVGQCWVYAKGTISIDVPTYVNVGDGGTELQYVPTATTIIGFGKQTTANTWLEYDFYDLIHTNNVYQGITTTTLGTTTIASPDENSSFIIPLHENVFKDLTLVRRTQLSLECSFLVVNYYDKQTIPWYASGFFQIVLVVVIIVVAVYTGYIGPESAGIFGTNAAVGATLGFAGTAAIIAGAIANAIAAAIVSALITKVAVSALGEDVGRIVGLIASMITINLMSSNGPFSLADSWTQMTKADNLIKLSMSGISEYGNYMQSQAIKVNAETQAMMAAANESLKEINRLMQELLGNTGVDPSTITNAIRYATENPEQFFSRTTMTGDDIAELSIKLVEDFPAPQLKLPYVT